MTRFFATYFLTKNWVPHFFSVLLACLYQRYLSLKIEQLFDVFCGIEEQPKIKANIEKKIKFLILIISTYHFINNNYKYNTC